MNPKNLKIETIPVQNRGGQQAGVLSHEVRVTHIPTGLYASCGFERSQSKNKKIALAMLEYALVELGITDT